MAHSFVLVLITELQKLADPEKAVAMQAYMKTDQPFFGVQAPARKKILNKTRRGFKPASFAEYSQIVEELWQGQTREEMYMAMEFAGAYKMWRTNEAWPLYCQLLRSAPHWDTVDYISSNLLGDLLLQHREHEAEVGEWVKSKSFWVRRAALLVHLNHKQATNVNQLFSTIEALMHEKEFFIRKAIGWVLRSYARTDPQRVLAFVEEHKERLSGLSRREALRHIE